MHAIPKISKNAPRKKMMIKFKSLPFLITLVWLVALTGCGGSDPLPEEVKITQLRAEQLRAVRSETWMQPPYVVRSAEEWAQAWATRGSNVASYCNGLAFFFCPKAGDFQMPTDIDFSKYTLVGLFSQISGNRVQSVESVTKQDNVIRVRTRLSAGLNLLPSQYLPSLEQASWNFFLISATALPIQFEQQSDVFVPYKEVSARWFFRSSKEFNDRGILKGGNEFNFEGTLIGAGTAEPATFLIDNQAAWVAAWKALPVGFIDPGFELPTINFDKEMFVGLSFGYGPSGCYGVSVINVVEDDAEIRVFYLRSVPSEYMVCTSVIVDVSAYITIKKSVKPVKFVRYIPQRSIQ